MVWTPKDAAGAEQAVKDALAEGRTLELVGTGTRRGFGRPVEAEVSLDLSALRGVVTYQPEELILAAGPATPMSEIAAMLAERSQCLAFEPPDFGPLWGLPAGLGTVGGAMMTGRGGPRRLTAGGPRDHCLGIKGVNGFGEAFAAGGRVVKNVTGFDVAKLATGSFGTLCVVTELTLKVLPAPPQAQTLAIRGLTDEAAMGVMAKALGCPAQVSSAAHLPADVAAHGSVTLLRVEGVGPSVTARIAHLAEVLSSETRQAVLDREASQLAWKEIADVALFAGGEGQVWKLSVPPMLGAAVGRRLADELAGRCFYDWGGGLVWLAVPAYGVARAAAIRAALKPLGGHATLVRASDAIRAAVDVFQPLAEPLMRVTAGIKKSFDPAGIFEPGRIYAGI